MTEEIHPRFYSRWNKYSKDTEDLIIKTKNIWVELWQSYHADHWPKKYKEIFYQLVYCQNDIIKMLDNIKTKWCVQLGTEGSW